MRESRELSELRNPLSSTCLCMIRKGEDESKNQLPYIAIAVPPRVIPTRLKVLFYKILEVIKELTSLSNRVGFSYLYIVIKEYNLVLALVIAYNKKRASNISVNKFK